MIASPALDLLMLKVVKEQAVFPPLKFHLKRDKIVNMCHFKEHCKFVFILKLINCPFENKENQEIAEHQPSRCHGNGRVEPSQLKI